MYKRTEKLRMLKLIIIPLISDVYNDFKCQTLFSFLMLFIVFNFYKHKFINILLITIVYTNEKKLNALCM